MRACFGAGDRLRRYDIALRRHPGRAGSLCADGGGRSSVEPAVGRDHHRHPAHATGRAASGRILTALARRPADPRLDWVIAIVISTLAGYLALARFLAQQLVVTGSILAFAYLLLLWVDGLMQGLGDDRAATGRWLKERVGQQAGAARAVSPANRSVAQYFCDRIVRAPHPAAVGLHMARRLRLVHPALLRVPRWKHASIRCGSTRFGDRLWAGLRRRATFQGWLDARVLKPAGISGGLRDSIRVGVGYVGVVIAALAAFSYAGFNLSNLAILAGAFSVGIGFGLQSVVNNFVSGLIFWRSGPSRLVTCRRWGRRGLCSQDQRSFDRGRDV